MIVHPAAVVSRVVDKGTVGDRGRVVKSFPTKESSRVPTGTDPVQRQGRECAIRDQCAFSRPWGMIELDGEGGYLANGSPRR